MSWSSWTSHGHRATLSQNSALNLGPCALQLCLQRLGRGCQRRVTYIYVYIYIYMYIIIYILMYIHIFGTDRPVVSLSHCQLSRCPFLPLSCCPVVPLSLCPVVPMSRPDVPSPDVASARWPVGRCRSSYHLSPAFSVKEKLL